MKKQLLLMFLWGCMSVPSLMAQQNLIPLNNFYREKWLENSGKNSIETFFPANENLLPLHNIIRDSTEQYFEFFDWLLRKHWINIEKKEGQLFISPLVDFSLGKEMTAEDRPRLFRNVRGIYAEGELFNKLAFNFIFAENQARFMEYETDYFHSAGEYYVSSSGYYQVNAMIPGAARTKPFKTDGLDYAYSIGNISYAINRKMRVELGNNQFFIGSGYRSLLLSDNTIGGIGLRYKWQVSDKFSVQLAGKMHKNMYRKPHTKAVEAPYENKFFGVTYFTYRPVKNISVSLFTGGNQLRGDSLIKHPFNYQMIVPLPFFQNDVLFGNSRTMNGITGLNAEIALNKIRLYGQVAVDRVDKKYLVAAQLGAHFFKALGLNNLHFQVETNYVPQHFYASKNPKLSYSNGNLPLAHIKGNNFAEGIFKVDYEWKRLYMNFKSVYYHNLAGNDTLNYAANSIFHIQGQDVPKVIAKTFVQEFEFGYRFNRRYNAMLYVAWKGRIYNVPGKMNNDQQFLVGLKTGIFNQYFDF